MQDIPLIMAFVAGIVSFLSPCVGPILGAILAFAGTQETVHQGVLLLSVYSLGLGLPFLLAALAMQSFLTLFRQVKGYLRTVEVGTGMLVIVMGLLMLTNNLTWIAGQLTFLNAFVW